MNTHTSPTRPTPPRALITLTLTWALAHTLLRLYWTLTHTRPTLPPTGDDLLLASDLPIIILGTATLALTPLLTRTTPPPAARTRLNTAYLIAAATAATSVLLLLDVVALLLLGTSGIPLHPLAITTRLAALTMGLLLAATARAAHRRWIATCPTCARTPRTRPALDTTPTWARAAAYLTVAAFTTRLLAQLFASGPTAPGTPIQTTPALIGLLTLLAAAGLLLPLALVHRFGRIWPRWVPHLAHRPIPRMLVLGPALFVVAAMNLYFLPQFVQLLIHGPTIYELHYPDWFFYASVGSYAAWGTGLALATHAYARRTRPRCPTCEQR